MPFSFHGAFNNPYCFPIIRFCRYFYQLSNIAIEFLADTLWKPLDLIQPDM